MNRDLEQFYSTSAQVVPVFLLLLLVETTVLKRIISGAATEVREKLGLFARVGRRLYFLFTVLAIILAILSECLAMLELAVPEVIHDGLSTVTILVSLGLLLLLSAIVLLEGVRVDWKRRRPWR